MKRTQNRRGRWLPLLFIPVLALLLMPPASSPVQAKRNPSNTTLLDAIIYLPTTTLQPLFQSRINQQVPGTTDSIITGIVSKLPQANQGWASQMAKALIQPSATVTQLTPQQDGLATTMNVSLYPNDPKPTTATMLVKFAVQNPTTIQVSAEPTNNSPALANGPLTTLQVPIGQLKSINATPNCGDSALGVGLQVPITLNQGQPTPQPTPQSTPQTSTRSTDTLFATADIHKPQDTLNSYVVVPATSLAALGNSIKNFSINQTLTAQNIRLGVQDSDLVLTSDISLWSTGVALATATTTIHPAAENGNLVLHVVKTTLTVFVFTFPDDSYNQQIEHMLNSELGNALAGKFTVTDAAIGANSHIPCADASGLVLTGTANIG